MTIRTLGVRPQQMRSLLPALSLAAVSIAIAVLNPRAISYFGLNLMLSLALPIVLVTVAQMFVMAGGELDLSIGSFVSFCGCVVATKLNREPLIGVSMLLAGIMAYIAIGALIRLRNLPSLVVTLGMSISWQGLALLVLPQPGGIAPDWLQRVMSLQTPLVPLPILGSVAIGAIGHVILIRSSYGAVLRGTGGNPSSISRSGWSVLKANMVLFGLAGLFGVLCSLALIGTTTSGDPNIGASYSLLSIAGVILGGGTFAGGIVSPFGAIFGALTLTLAASPLLTFLHVPPDWQIGANGALLIVVIALRSWTGTPRDE